MCAITVFVLLAILATSTCTSSVSTWSFARGVEYCCFIGSSSNRATMNSFIINSSKRLIKRDQYITLCLQPWQMSSNKRSFRCPPDKLAVNSRKNHGAGRNKMMKTFSSNAASYAEVPMKEVVKDDMNVDVFSPTTSTTHLSNVEFSSLQDISNESKRSIKEVLKYQFLTKVQHATLDTVLSGKDVVGKAKTGTGKTVAFLLPVIERIIRRPPTERSISCLILSPNRELAMQIAKEAQALCTFHKKISIGCFIGGTNIKQDIKKLENGIDILIGTPGRLVDHLKNDNVNLQERVAHLDMLVLDEADQLLDMGFQRDIDTILSYLPSVADRQTVMFSATFSDSVKKIAQRAFKRDHIYIDTIEEGGQQTNTHVPQVHMKCTLDTLTSSIESILAEHMKSQQGYKVLVFFNTARTAGFMAQLFQTAGYKALEMHSRKSQTYRVKVAKQFHEGKNIIMFSSDVSARGVDYPNVTLIVQVGLTEKEQYIHRLGRTGRAGRTGRGVLLLCDFEARFLKELGDLEIYPAEIPQVDNKDLKSTVLLQQLPNALRLPGEQGYQAFLGYYKSNLKRIGMDKVALVRLANHYSRTIGFEEPPTLEKKTVGKMGLKGVPGIRVA